MNKSYPDNVRVQVIHRFCTAKKKLAGYWSPHLTSIKLVNISGLRYSKQIEFQEELINFLRT